MTSLFAVRGLQDFETSQSGHNVVNATDGSDVWSMDAAGVRQSYLILNETTGVGALQDAIDNLICAKPKALKSDDPVSVNQRSVHTQSDQGWHVDVSQRRACWSHHHLCKADESR